MKKHHRISRRSFLGQVCAGLTAAGGSLGFFVGQAGAGQITDRDPSDPVGRGRGGGSGITDRDAGPGADPAGRGRGATLPSDAGVTDSDTGAGADPIGRGRGGGGRQVTGITDSDSGAYADPPQRGRGGRPRSNIDIPDDQRAERCENNRRRIAELERQTHAPEGWSERQLAQAAADLQAVRAAVQTLQDMRNVTADVLDRGWAVVGPIAARYGIPMHRTGYWANVSLGIEDQIGRARRAEADRIELHRQIDAHRNNLIALGC